MANNPYFSDEAASASVAAVAALCDGGTINIYDGAKPADSNTAITNQNLLASLTLGSPAFATPATVSGTAPSRKATVTANAITDDTSADATGTATWFRVLKADGTSPVYDGEVGTSGSDLNLATTSITAGEDVSITSWTLSQPE